VSREARVEVTRMLQASRRVERLTRELQEARETLRLRIVAAHDAGASVSEIARQLGVTRTRVYQLIERS
jgi:DNA-directed RNA polymerase sigma subunit (sigma70/sigma32)